MEFCAIASGSSGNCVYVRHEDTRILVDAGISGKKICEGLGCMDICPDSISAILITHDHSDHIQGAAVLANKYKIPLYGTEGTIKYIIDHSTRGIPAGLVHFIRPDFGFEIGKISVNPFRTSHDAIDPVGYTLSAAGKKLGVATDLGVYTDYTIEKLMDSDALYLESNHDLNMLMVGPYPYPLKKRIHSELGHLSNDDACEFILKLQSERLKNIVLAHLSKENNFPELALRTAQAAIHEGWRGKELPQISVAKRSEPSPVIVL